MGEAAAHVAVGDHAGTGAVDAPVFGVVAESVRLNDAVAAQADSDVTNRMAFHLLWHGASSVVEAARMTVERCSDFEQVPCLLVSVDGFLTVQIPKSRRIVDLFMLANEIGMSEEDKRRVGLAYGQKEWRALARGKRGGWYPVANASSEFDAIERALGSCAQQENECRLHAVSNFRVADE